MTIRVIRPKLTCVASYNSYNSPLKNSGIMEDNHSHIHAFTQSRISDELRFMTDGFADWVERRERRRQNIFRSALLVVAVAACVGSAARLMPEHTDTYVSGNLQCCADDACSRVNVMMASL